MSQGLQHRDPSVLPRIGEPVFFAGSMTTPSFVLVGTGHVLRVFNGAGGMVVYMGEFEVDSDDPFYIAYAPPIGGGPLREVIVFRFASA
jgi:hypothetical protein